MVKSRIFLFLLLAFITGVAVRSFTPVPYFLLWFGLVIFTVSIVWGIWCKRKVMILGGFLFLAVLAGIIRFDLHDNFRPDLTDFYDQPLVLRGVIVEDPERTESVQRLKMEVKTIEEEELKSDFYVLVTVRLYPAYQIGDELELNGLLQKPENYSDFDYISFLAKEGIFSTMYFPLAEKVDTGQGNKTMLLLAKIKQSFEEKMDMILPEPHSSFLKGLLLGEKESLPSDLVENFKRTGTTHIVALSGYNITLVARFFLTLLLLLTVPFFISFWIASLAIILFVVMVGASPSVVRAGVMGILVLLADREGRPYHITNALAFAGTLMLWQNPKILRFDAAFQLSFLATLGLVYISPFLEKIFQRRRSTLRPEKEGKIISFKKTFIETLSAQLIVLPLLIYLFGQVSLVSPLVNVLILLAVPYAMVVGFAAVMFYFFYHPLGQILGWAVWVLLEYKIRIINLFADLPLASVRIAGWAWIFLATFYILLLGIFIKISRRREP